MPFSFSKRGDRSTLMATSVTTTTDQPTATCAVPQATVGPTVLRSAIRPASKAIQAVVKGKEMSWMHTDAVTPVASPLSILCTPTFASPSASMPPPLTFSLSSYPCPTFNSICPETSSMRDYLEDTYQVPSTSSTRSSTSSSSSTTITTPPLPGCDSSSLFEPEDETEYDSGSGQSCGSSYEESCEPKSPVWSEFGQQRSCSNSTSRKSEDVLSERTAVDEGLCGSNLSDLTSSGNIATNVNTSFMSRRRSTDLSLPLFRSPALECASPPSPTKRACTLSHRKVHFVEPVRLRSPSKERTCGLPRIGESRRRLAAAKKSAPKEPVSKLATVLA